MYVCAKPCKCGVARRGASVDVDKTLKKKRISCADDVSNWRESPTGMAAGRWQQQQHQHKLLQQKKKEQQIGRLYRWLVSEVWILSIYLISSCLWFTLRACRNGRISPWKSRKPICLAQITAMEGGLGPRRVKTENKPNFIGAILIILYFVLCRVWTSNFINFSR